MCVQQHTSDDMHEVNPRARAVGQMEDMLFNSRANVQLATPCLFLSYPLESFVKLHGVTVIECLFTIPN